MLRSPLRLLVVAGTLATSLAACQMGSMATGADDISTRQAMLDLGLNMTTLREENAMMQAQIDSLRTVIAYQDTVVRQLAAAAGLAMRPPTMMPTP